MRHEIKLPGLYDDELRTVAWDDAAGTVEGDHEIVPDLQAELASGVVVLAFPWGTLDAEDPRHDAADFLAVLAQRLGTLADADLGDLADVTPTHLPYPAHYEADGITC